MNHVWMVEVKTEKGWLPYLDECHDTRGECRDGLVELKRIQKEIGDFLEISDYTGYRIRKYVREEP